MSNSISQLVQVFTAQLDQAKDLRMMNSFDVTANPTPNQTKNIFSNRICRLTITQFQLENLFVQTEHIKSKPAEFGPTINCLDNFIEQAESFRVANWTENHSSTCPNYQQFLVNFPIQERPKSEWTEILADCYRRVNLEPRDFGSQIFEFQENNQDGQIHRFLTQITSRKILEKSIIRLYVCFLHFQKRMTAKQIALNFPLTIHQVKKAFSKYKKGDFHKEYVERRGLHKKQQIKIDDQKLAWIEKYVHEKTDYFTITNLMNDFRNQFPECPVSYQTLHRALKYRLRFKFGKQPLNPPNKNYPKTKTYRFWFAHYLLRRLNQSDIVVSIDECSFSCYKETISWWFDPKQSNKVRNSLSTNWKNISLLLAVSQFGVVGWLISEGAIKGVQYADFLLRLDQKMTVENSQNKRIVYVMDNLRAHRNKLAEAIIKTRKMSVVFTPPYSPELNFVEFVFTKLKLQFRRLCKNSQL